MSALPMTTTHGWDGTHPQRIVAVGAGEQSLQQEVT